MSPKSTNLLLLALTLVSCLCFAGCSGETDVTSSAQFRDMAGKCFATKEGFFLHYSKTGEDYSIAPAAGEDATSDMPLSVEDYQLHREKFAPHTMPFIVDVLPAGTHITVTRLVDEIGSGGSLAFGRVTDGKYAGKQVGIWELLENPNLANSPTAKIDRYEVNPKYLEPAGCGK